MLADSALAQARQLDAERSQGAYRGPLHGIPVAQKDLYNTKGVRTTAGSKILADFVPEHNATVVSKLDADAALVEVLAALKLSSSCVT